jgi:hypothetical protein
MDRDKYEVGAIMERCLKRLVPEWYHMKVTDGGLSSPVCAHCYLTRQACHCQVYTMYLKKNFQQKKQKKGKGKQNQQNQLMLLALEEKRKKIRACVAVPVVCVTCYKDGNSCDCVAGFCNGGAREAIVCLNCYQTKPLCENLPSDRTTPEANSEVHVHSEVHSEAKIVGSGCGQGKFVVGAGFATGPCKKCGVSMLGCVCLNGYYGEMTEAGMGEYSPRTKISIMSRLKLNYANEDETEGKEDSTTCNESSESGQEGVRHHVRKSLIANASQLKELITTMEGEAKQSKTMKEEIERNSEEVKSSIIEV